MAIHVLGADSTLELVAAAGDGSDEPGGAGRSAQLGVPGRAARSGEAVLVEDVATTSKTFPDFPGAWTALLQG